MHETKYNSSYLRQVILSLLTMICSISYAYDFEVDGLCYNIIGSDQVEVTYREWDGNSYSGNIQIPETVTFNDILYHVTAIGELAFSKCTDLSGSLTLPNSLTCIGNFAFSFCNGLTGPLIIPNSVTYIGDAAFQYCLGLTGSLTIPNSVTYLGNFAFNECNGLSGTLSIPNTVSSIGDYTFSGCRFTGTLSFPSSITSIGKEAFRGCDFSGTLKISKSITFIGEMAFSYCGGLTSIIIDKDNTSYDSRDNCNAIIDTKSNILINGCATTIIPNSVKSIAQSAFAGSGLTSISIPNSVLSVGTQAFASCTSLTSVNLPNSVSSIEEATFTYCSSLLSITIPNSVESIGKRAFSYCTKLNTAIIPNSIKRIDVEAFDFCTSLEHVYSSIISPFRIEQSTFRGISGSSVLHIPKGTKEAYNQYENWICHFSKVIEEGVEDHHTLSIKATGNGTASYGGSNIRGRSSAFTVNDGTSVTITFEPDTGYRIQSVKVNNTDVTSKLSNNTYTFNLTSDTSVEVVFEAIPKTTYTLTIKATGNGTASYGGSNIRGRSSSFTVNDGTSVTVTFEPDTGYRIKGVNVNSKDVTSKLSNYSYTMSVTSDTSVEVEFEKIPDDPDTPKTYTLSIRAKGNGIATYNEEDIRATTKTYTLEEGTKIVLTFTPDEGNQIKSLRVNGEYLTITDSYETTINADTSIKIDFEEIPDEPDLPVTYTLSIMAKGDGIAVYDGETIRDKTSTFTLEEGTKGTITFTPDEGYHIKSLIVNGSAISIGTSYDFTMISDTSVEVEFEVTVVEREFTVDGTNYEITSFEDHTVILETGDYGLTLVVPDKINYQDEEWTITGIAEGALDHCEDLAAIIWNPEIPFNVRVSNPNLLLYVKDESYAPVSINNVIVNGYSQSITLTDAQNRNNFYCPGAFTTQSISYTHNYLMKTGLNESRGWETIALPFDVQKISHSSKGEIVPFAKWTSDSSAKPFWLYELSGSGFVEAEAIKANTPYIISMPNNEAYPGEYQLTGRVTFSSENVEVKKSDEVQTATYSSNTFMPSFTNMESEAGYYALNVNNDYEYYRGVENEGSMFILNLRNIHPFEAYMTSTSGTRSIDISEGMTTDIRGVDEIVASEKTIKVYDISGRLIKIDTTMETIRQELPAGVYIVNNRKMIIK